LIWGAIKWITSGGDKGKVDAARNTIVAAVIGLIVLLLSFVIINFAIQIVGAGNGIFDICIPSLNGAKTCR
jgi:lipopolysaccharide/colanic/teichoic acid biosynthesis glycosyltransferase